VLIAIASSWGGAALAQAPSEQQASGFGADPGATMSSAGNVFFGGYVGVSYGDIEYIEVAPLVGYRFTPNFGAGLGLLYRYRRDTRGANDLTATDYGGNLFARYYLFSGLFAQAEYDYTSYEYPTDSHAGTTGRGTYDSFLVGAGYNAGFGGGAGVYLLALYDFNYSSSDPYRLYNSPLQLRIGVSVGF
jgi:hypothetical protein